MLCGSDIFLFGKNNDNNKNKDKLSIQLEP